MTAHPRSAIAFANDILSGSTTHALRHTWLHATSRRQENAFTSIAAVTSEAKNASS